MHPRTSSSLVTLALALLLAGAGLAAAQNRPKIPPPDFQREWEVDAEGLRQWKAFEVACPHCKGSKQQECEHCKDSKVPICLECAGEKRAPCRVCAATGKLLDPLVELVCPYCDGSAWYACGLCNSWGSLTVEGVETKCGACKQKGLLECGACQKKRRVAVCKVGKKGPADASIADLDEALALLKETLAELEKFEPEDNPSRTSKTLAKTLAPLNRRLEVTKDMHAMLEQVLKGVNSYGAGYQSYKDRLIHQFLVFKDRAVYLLQFQIRLVEQCLERANFNAAEKEKK